MTMLHLFLDVPHVDYLEMCSQRCRRSVEEVGSFGTIVRSRSWQGPPELSEDDVAVAFGAVPPPSRP
jgi:hypothetical protein